MRQEARKIGRFSCRPLVAVLATVTSGFLLYASLPPLDLSFLAWVALVPLFVALAHSRPWQAGCLGYLMGATLMGWCLNWTLVISGFPTAAYPTLVLIYAAFYGLFGYALQLVIQRTAWPIMLVAAPLWVCFEFARVNAGFLALPGALLGHTQYENIPILQIASIGSAYGISFLIVLVNAGISEVIVWVLRVRNVAARVSGVPSVARPAWSVGIALAVAMLAYLWGDHRASTYMEDGQSVLKVAAIQANISQDKKWNAARRRDVMNRYASLSRQAAKDGPDLIVWPETAVPGYLKSSRALVRAVGQVTEETGTALLLGSSSSAKGGPRGKLRKEFKNSAFLLSRDGEILGEYQKIRLLPFAEYVPFAGWVPWPKWLTSEGDSYTAGTDVTVFKLSQTHFGVVICWEALFPDPFREFVRRGAEFMVNLTEEAWFHRSQASRLFFGMAVFRAVENGVPLLRAGNTGISALIDPRGVIRGRVTDEAGNDLGVSGILSTDIPARWADTFYTRHGDLFAQACVVVTVALLALALVPGWMRRRRQLFALPTAAYGDRQR